MYEHMDFRSFLAGILPAAVSCICALALSISAGFSLMSFLALLVLVLPVIALLSYLLGEVRALNLLIRQQTRQVSTTVYEQTSDLKKQYSDTMHQIMELNAELRRRIYR